MKRRWRLFLPSKWRTACGLNDDGNMDPNMTLAHITHNAAVIQLHQSIAYPSKQWSQHSAMLPSTTSATTCLAAAREIVMISTEYLRASCGITNPQFSFCLFIAGRVLLGKWRTRCYQAGANPRSSFCPPRAAFRKRDCQPDSTTTWHLTTLERRTLHGVCRCMWKFGIPVCKSPRNCTIKPPHGQSRKFKLCSGHPRASIL